MENGVSWNTTPCNLMHIYDVLDKPFYSIFRTESCSLKIMLVGSSETSVCIYQSTWQDISANITLHTDYCEKHESQLVCAPFCILHDVWLQWQLRDLYSSAEQQCSGLYTVLKKISALWKTNIGLYLHYFLFRNSTCLSPLLQGFPHHVNPP
jgi:hypothetical protein